MSNSSFIDIAVSIIKSNEDMIDRVRYEGEKSNYRLNTILSNTRHESEQSWKRMDEALEKHAREMVFLRKEMEKITSGKQNDGN